MSKSLYREEIRHGTNDTYTLMGCRCESCRTARKRYKKWERENDVFDHGTNEGYVEHHCRCKECRAARAEHTWRLRRED